MPRQESNHRHHKAGCAEPALQAVAFVESLLDGMQGSVIRRKAFDRRHVMAFGLDRQHQARPDRLSVEQDCAAAAHAVLASDVSSGEAEVMAQVIRQQPARIDRRRMRNAIDPQAAKTLSVRICTR